jgi:sugar lactone lactonase YvrE
MKNIPVGILAIIFGLTAGCNVDDLAETSTESTIESMGTVERLDPALDLLVPIDATIEKVAGGFGFTEGPVWVPGLSDRLLFSDIPANTVYSWSDDEGLKVFLQPVTPDNSNTGGTGGSNGLALGGGNVFFDASTMEQPGAPDGLALDQSGNIYATGPGGVLIFDASGKHLGTISPNEVPAFIVSSSPQPDWVSLTSSLAR